MAEPARNGRWRQRQRTRKDLLQAASRLLKDGRKPSLEEVADEAQVSRATAYRYFPNVDALLVEAPLDLAVPGPEDLFADAAAPQDPVERLERVDDALHAMIAANEAPLRLMLARAIERPVAAPGDGELPLRQNRRAPLIEAALAPAAGRIAPPDLAALRSALALFEGPETMIVFKDVLQLDDEEARRVRRWALRALTEAALASASAATPPGRRRRSGGR